MEVGDPEGAEKTDFKDAKWERITLPCAWNQAEVFKKDIVDLSTGIAWYRKTFQLPTDAEKGKVFIEFEGVRQMREVFVNGHLIGRSENGVMTFGFDITPFMKAFPAKNLIAVKTNNDWEYKEELTNTKYQWSNKKFNANYGGIPKNVYLHTTTKVFQTLPLYSSLGTTVTGFRKTAFENGMIYLNDRVIMMKGYAQRTSNEWPSVGFLCLHG